MRQHIRHLGMDEVHMQETGLTQINCEEQQREARCGNPETNLEFGGGLGRLLSFDLGYALCVGVCLCVRETYCQRPGLQD